MEEPLLAVVGDIHANFHLLSTVLERVSSSHAAGLLIVGDLANGSNKVSSHSPAMQRYRQQIRDVLDSLSALGLPMAWVPGNHDLPNLQGGRNADGRVLEVAGLRVLGIGGSGPARFGFPYEWDESDIRSRPSPACDIILSHTPPLGTRLDLTASGHHAGSQAILERARALRGVLVCGHIHEAGGTQRLGDCLCLNAGSLGSPFGFAQLGFIQGTDKVMWEDLETGRTEHLER